jgi:predicted TIM-barrel fold metal-dependent hydrolase
MDVLQKATGIEVLSLGRLVDAMNASIDAFMASGRLAAIKIGIAYRRDLSVTNPTTHEAELAFNRIRSRKSYHEGLQQNAAAVNAGEARPLADYLFHRLIERANDEDLPVQIHTGYLAGNWGSLAGTKALHLLSLFDTYRRVRFDVFHASWPWTSELGAIAKNYPNVYPDMCWAWTMNPAQSERALCEWLDAVPYTKIFAYGADTNYPWCNAGYAIQARKGIARVLEQKVADGHFSEATAREVAAAIMVGNGERFYRL